MAPITLGRQWIYINHVMYERIEWTTPMPEKAVIIADVMYIPDTVPARHVETTT